MMYVHFCEPNGDSIMKNLFAIKKRMGANGLQIWRLTQSVKVGILRR